MNYVDGFVVAVPNKNKETYIMQAKDFAAVFKEHGALKLVECWGDNVPEGELTSFPLAVKCKEDESVVFSWIVWPSKSVRDAAMEKLMSDPRMADENIPVPYDGKRMIFGSFQMVLEE